MGSIRVAIVGVGNCASSLIQGVEFYKNANPEARVPGLMHVDFGGYHVRDVQFVAAFDVDGKKVGRDLSEVIVQRGHTFDGLGDFYRELVEESDYEPVDVVKVLTDAKVDVLVSYLPV